jgi:O-antigen/teichoic acid export membrane protein
MQFGRITKNKITKNALWIIIGKLAQSILALFINLIMARYLGPSNYGLISYAASIVAFVAPIMNLGFSNVLVQEVTNQPEQEGTIFGSAILLSTISAVACIISVTIYTFIVDAGETITNRVVMLYSILLIFQAFELIQYWFQAKLLSKYMSIASLIAYILVAAYKIILLIIGASVSFFAVSNALDSLLIAVALIICYKKCGGKRLSFSKNVAKNMFANSKHYIISSMMVTIFAETDKIMLKAMVGEQAVGFYSAATTISCMTSFVFLAVIDSMRPVIFQYKKEENNSEYENKLTLTYSMVIYMSILQCVFMTALSDIIVKVLYGNQYIDTIFALRIVVWFTTFSYIGSVRNIWILGENKQKYLWVINFSGALMNVFLNFLLIPHFGINGAAVASVITQFFTNIIVSYIISPLKYNNLLIWRSLNPRLLIGIIKGLK